MFEWLLCYQESSTDAVRNDTNAHAHGESGKRESEEEEQSKENAPVKVSPEWSLIYSFTYLCKNIVNIIVILIYIEWFQ